MDFLHFSLLEGESSTQKFRSGEFTSRQFCSMELSFSKTLPLRVAHSKIIPKLDLVGYGKIAQTFFIFYRCQIF